MQLFFFTRSFVHSFIHNYHCKSRNRKFRLLIPKLVIEQIDLEILSKTQKTSSREFGGPKRVSPENRSSALLLNQSALLWKYLIAGLVFRKASPPRPNETLVTSCRYQDLPCGIRVSKLLSNVKVTPILSHIVHPVLITHCVLRDLKFSRPWRVKSRSSGLWCLSASNFTLKMEAARS
jgi:hypothetical protein